METTIKIDSKDVRFKATAAVPMMYRMKFRRDLLTDIQRVAEALEREKQNGAKSDGAVLPSSLPVHALTMFEQMAYIMAKHADPAMEADTPMEWMEQFSTMSIYAVFPVIQSLWEGNMERLVEAKKKAELSIERLQRPCSSFELSSSESLSETSNS